MQTKVRMGKEMPDTYKTIGKKTTIELVVKRSRFIAQAFPIEDDKEADRYLACIKEEHKQASHHCQARVLGQKGDRFFVDDDGEPHNSAGRPILGAITSLGLSQVLVVVTRYFGGKKLGIRGLIDAYGQAASLALDKAGSLEVIPSLAFSLTCDYKDVDSIHHQISLFTAKIETESFLKTVTMQVRVARSSAQDLMDALAPYVTDLEVLSHGKEK